MPVLAARCKTGISFSPRYGFVYLNFLRTFVRKQNEELCPTSIYTYLAAAQQRRRTDICLPVRLWNIAGE
jgi:hypothetical protein